MFDHLNKKVWAILLLILVQTNMITMHHWFQIESSLNQLESIVYNHMIRVVHGLVRSEFVLNSDSTRLY